jgi:hypothetical protein
MKFVLSDADVMPPRVPGERAVWMRFKTCTFMGKTSDTKAQGVLVVQNLATGHLP